jgi:murein hydrolase activator
MLIRFLHHLLLALLFLQLPLGLQAQQKKDLERKRQLLEREIDEMNRKLNETKRSKSLSLSQIVNLNKKIESRKLLISNINFEIGHIDQEIGSISSNISSIKLEATQLSGQYAQLLYHQMRTKKSINKWMYVWSSPNVNAAYKRMQLLHYIGFHRVQQRQRLLALQDSLTGKRIVLEDKLKEKNSLLDLQQVQHQALQTEKKEQVKVLNHLSASEQKIKNQLKEKIAQEQKLNKRIEDIIRREMNAMRQPNKKEGSKNSNTRESGNVKNYNLTPEAAKLSQDFSSNKGKLPWPVEAGRISSSFGRHSHPVWRDVVINNNGIDIASAKGAAARSIFGGTVKQVFMIMDKYAIVVQHGEYFSVYSNLSSVHVKSGEKIATKQSIGILKTDDTESKTELHLEIWKGSNKLDPQLWIVKR